MFGKYGENAEALSRADIKVRLKAATRFTLLVST